MLEKIIDVVGLVKLLEGYAGHTIGYLRLLTVPKFNKTSRVTGQTFQQVTGVDPANIRKISLWSVRIGYDYETSMKNALEKIGNTIGAQSFQVGQLWKGKGEHVTLANGQTSKTLVRHVVSKDLYVIVQVNSWGANGTAKQKATRIRSMYVDMSTGKQVDKALLKDFQSPSYDQLVQFRTLKLSSIKRLAFRNEVYNLA